VSGQHHAPAAFYSRGNSPPMLITWEAWWAPEPVWTQRLDEKSSASVGDRNPGVQSIVRHYTDWATRLFYWHRPTHIFCIGEDNKFLWFQPSTEACRKKTVFWIVKPTGRSLLTFQTCFLQPSSQRSCWPLNYWSIYRRLLSLKFTRSQFVSLITGS
jgi:hypothetical protein